MTVEIHEGEEGAEVAEAGAEAAEAAAEAAEAIAEAAETVAEAAETVAEAGEGGEGGEGGEHTDGDLAQAMVIGAGLQSLADHLGNEDVHHSAEEIRTMARSVLWEEAESLAQYAAATAEAEAPADTETIVTTDVPENDRDSEHGVRRFF